MRGPAVSRPLSRTVARRAGRPSSVTTVPVSTDVPERVDAGGATARPPTSRALLRPGISGEQRQRERAHSELRASLLWHAAYFTVKSLSATVGLSPSTIVDWWRR